MLTVGLQGQCPRYVTPSSAQALTSQVDTSGNQPRQRLPTDGSHQARCQETQVLTLALSITSCPTACRWANCHFTFPGLS